MKLGVAEAAGLVGRTFLKLLEENTAEENKSFVTIMFLLKS